MFNIKLSKFRKIEWKDSYKTDQYNLKIFTDLIYVYTMNRDINKRIQYMLLLLKDFMFEYDNNSFNN